MSLATSVSLAKALVDDAFYRAVSVSPGFDLELQEKILSEYFQLALVEGCQTGRVDMIDGHGSGSAIWALPYDLNASSAAYDQRKQGLQSVLGPVGLAAFNAIVQGMETNLTPYSLAESWYLSIAGSSPSPRPRKGCHNQSELASYHSHQHTLCTCASVVFSLAKSQPCSRSITPRSTSSREMITVKNRSVRGRRRIWITTCGQTVLGGSIHLSLRTARKSSATRTFNQRATSTTSSRQGIILAWA